MNEKLFRNRFFSINSKFNFVIKRSSSIITDEEINIIKIIVFFKGLKSILSSNKPVKNINDDTNNKEKM